MSISARFAASQRSSTRQRRWRGAAVLGLTWLLALGSTDAQTVFNLVPDPGTPTEVTNAFTAATRLWSEVLGDNITVNIRVGYQELPSGVIGQTATGWAYPDPPSYTAFSDALLAHRTSADDYLACANLPGGTTYSRWINHTSNNLNGPNSATPYVDTMDWVGLTRANAKALGFSLSDPGGLDGAIIFSSSFTYDYDHGSTIAPGAIDFVGAAAHEIGHVLGFISGVDDIDTAGGSQPGTDFSSNVIDFFRYSAESVAAGYLDYTADTRDKYFSLDGGATAIASFSTGVNYGDGHQASHWKDDLGIGLMDPTGSYGERLDISSTDLRLFDVIGYAILPEPGTGTLLVLGFVLWLRHSRRRGHG